MRFLIERHSADQFVFVIKKANVPRRPSTVRGYAATCFGSQQKFVTQERVAVTDQRIPVARAKLGDAVCNYGAHSINRRLAAC